MFWLRMAMYKDRFKGWIQHKVAETSHPMECEECEMVGYSKKAVSILHIIFLVLITLIAYVVLNIFLNYSISLLVYVLIDIMGLVLLSYFAPQRCPKCMTTEIKEITEEEFKEKIGIK